MKNAIPVLKSVFCRNRWLFVAAFAARLAALVHIWHSYPPEGTWGTNEAGSIAKTLLLHHRFGSTFHDFSGPTAWLAPGYPAVVAVVFLVFGIETRISAIALMLLNAVFTSATALLIRALGRQFFDDSVGLLAAWAWALCPMGAVLSFIIWDTSLSALMLCWAVLAVVQADSAGKWGLSGAVWGLAGLLNPALLAPLPFLLISLGSRAGARRVLWFVTCLTAVLLPWTVRNELVLHAILPVRSNAWAEIYYGNISFAPHPLGPSMEYQKLGEIEYVKQLKGEAVEYIRTHPAIFWTKTLRRIFLFWILPFQWLIFTVPLSLGSLVGLGIAFRRIKSQAWPLASIGACYPLIYYITYALSRYRHPIEPFMYLLAAFVVCNLLRLARERLRPLGKGVTILRRSPR